MLLTFPIYLLISVCRSSCAFPSGLPLFTGHSLTLQEFGNASYPISRSRVRANYFGTIFIGPPFWYSELCLLPGVERLGCSPSSSLPTSFNCPLPVSSKILWSVDSLFEEATNPGVAWHTEGKRLRWICLIVSYTSFCSRTSIWLVEVCMLAPWVVTFRAFCLVWDTGRLLIVQLYL